MYGHFFLSILCNRYVIVFIVIVPEDVELFTFQDQRPGGADCRKKIVSGP